MSGSFPAIDANCCGVRLGPIEMDLTPRALLGYAAALGATDDVYMDDLRSGGIIGLPPFIVVPEWKIVNGEGYRTAVGMDDAGMWACLHVQQDSVFFQPMRPGMRIATSGEICSVRRTRIGTHVATRLTTRCVRTNAQIAESWFSGIFLNRFPNGPDCAVEHPPELLKGTITAPPQPMLKVDRALPHLYTEASAIWNPIHTERARAKQAGLADTLLHGTCTWAAAGRALIDLLADGDPTRLRRLGGRFAGQAPVGTDLFLAVEPATETTSRYQVTDGQGRIILADGTICVS